MKYIIRKVKSLHDKCDPGFGFDNIFKPDNHILSVVSNVNEMVG